MPFRDAETHQRYVAHTSLHRCWRCSTALVLLIALAILLIPLAHHSHPSLLVAVISPLFLFFSVVSTFRWQLSLLDESFVVRNPLFRLPSLSHLPPPAMLA